MDCCRFHKVSQTWRERKQKHGCKSGLLLRRRNQLPKPLLQSLHLSSSRSKWTTCITGNRSVRDCCVLIITESWLHQRLLDASVQLAGRTALPADQTVDSSKSRRGGLCIYVHEDWCNNSMVLKKHCHRDLEDMSIRRLTFFLSREQQ